MSDLIVMMRRSVSDICVYWIGYWHWLILLLSIGYWNNQLIWFISTTLQFGPLLLNIEALVAASLSVKYFMCASIELSSSSPCGSIASSAVACSQVCHAQNGFVILSMVLLLDLCMKSPGRVTMNLLPLPT